jgi:alkylation response protein AidB-like acyl-CoA dehydrogenase
MTALPAVGTGAPPRGDFESRAREASGGIVPLVPAAERDRRFPREAVALLGAAGLLRERWAAPDASLGVVLCEELGVAGASGVGLGVSVHAEAALSMLARFARTPLLRSVLEDALDGRNLVAVAASEAASGSDLAGIETVVSESGGGLTVRGQKRYVSLGVSADHLLVSCRSAVKSTESTTPRLSLVLVPRDDVKIEKQLETVGVRATETARVTIDARVPREAMLGRPGAGMLALSYGLTHERLATAALTIGTCRLALGLASAHLEGRRVRAEPLITRQAPRFLLAAHAAHVDVLRRSAHSLATMPLGSSRGMRDVAGLKVTAAQVGERVLSDCMHLFGGAGYLEDETPLARLWRDVRAARVGGGTDEMMLELVAGGLVPATEAYASMVRIPS